MYYKSYWSTRNIGSCEVFT